MWWLFNSTALILFNKFILTIFPFPATLTFIHMLIASLCCLFLVHGAKIADRPSINAKTIFLISTLFTCSLLLRNAAYMYISVAVIQIISAFSPIAVYISVCAFNLERFNHRHMSNIYMICCGVCTSSFGLIHVDWIGIGLQITGIAVEAIRTAALQMLLQNSVAKPSNVSLMYVLAPSCAILLSPICCYELLMLNKAKIRAQNAMLIFLNSCVALTMNLASLYVIQISSSLTISLASVLRDWILVGLSCILFKSQLTLLCCTGWAISTVGLILHAKGRNSDLK